MSYMEQKAIEEHNRKGAVMMEYTKYNDPGHGWLRVKFSELVKLGIENQISNYSYHNKFSVYLEEDCDAQVFRKAKQATGEAITVTNKYTNNRSSIRSFESYNLEHAKSEIARLRRNKNARDKNAILSELCGTSARQAKIDMGLLGV